MRSEFKFFMSEHDEAVFVAAFRDSVNSIEKQSNRQWLFCVGDCKIQFLRSYRSSTEISQGRIAIATHGSGVEFSAGSETERLFKRMRSRLKKEYTNRLCAQNVTIPQSSHPYRNVWLGPDALARVRTGSIALISDPTSRIVWREE